MKRLEVAVAGGLARAARPGVGVERRSTPSITMRSISLARRSTGGPSPPRGTIRRPWSRCVSAPLTVPDAHPPTPFVTRQSRVVATSQSLNSRRP
jgi:hypothetical protein